MKLYYTGNSPYARRARLALRYSGLMAEAEEVDIESWETNLDTLLASGPGGKVPVLALDDGSSLCESLIIARYLDHRSGGRLYPAGGALRKVLEIESVACVLMDSLFARSRENRRDAQTRSQTIITREAERAARCYAALDKHVPSFGDKLSMPTLTIIADMAYADFRHDADGWRNKAPSLAKWYEEVSIEAMVAETAPVY